MNQELMCKNLDYHRGDLLGIHQPSIHILISGVLIHGKILPMTPDFDGGFLTKDEPKHNRRCEELTEDEDKRMIIS